MQYIPRIYDVKSPLLLTGLQHKKERELFARAVFGLRAGPTLAHAVRYPFFEACECEAVLGKLLDVELERAVVRECRDAGVGARVHLYGVGAF